MEIEIQKYTEQKCPYCKSKNLNFDVYEPVDDFFKQHATCNICEKDFIYWADKPQFWEVHYEK